MKYPQVLVCEGDGRIARLLKEPIQAAGWLLRESSQADTLLAECCIERPTVLVIKVGRDLVREFGLLRRVAEAAPDIPVVVVTEMENPLLAGLAWDLGASCVLMPSQAREQLPGIVTGLLRGAIGRTAGRAG